MTYSIVNGNVVDADDAVISVEDRGFRYGDGAFETIAVHNGVPYQFDWHMARLAAGLKAIKIPFDVQRLKPYALQLLRKNDVQHGILRMQISRGIGSKGYRPDPGHPKAGASFVLETTPAPTIMHQPVALWQSTYQKISAQALPMQYKLCQGISSTLARMEATEHHCADALLCNERGDICETSSGNLFWLKDGTLYTPDLECGVLMGSTRHAIMQLSPLPVTQTRATPETLMQADAIVISNVVWPVLPVGALLPAEAQFSSAELATQLHELLYTDRIRYSHEHHEEWSHTSIN